MTRRRFVNGPEPLIGYVQTPLHPIRRISGQLGWLTCQSPDIPYQNDKRKNPPLRGFFLVVAAYL